MRLRWCLKSIRTLLQPTVILDKYHQLAPFTWTLLETISASPNRHRKYNAKTNEFEGDEEENDDWNDDPNCDDDEPEKKWDLKMPQGFSRNSVLVGYRTMLKMAILITLQATMIMAISMLIFARNQPTNILPLMMGLFLKINGTSSRVMTIFKLSNAGVCVSGRTVERLKKRISDDAIKFAVELVASGRLFSTIRIP